MAWPAVEGVNTVKKKLGFYLRAIGRTGWGKAAKHFYWRGRLANRWTQTRFFRQVRAVRRSLPQAPVPGANVLLFATRQDREQLAMIVTIGWALRLRGMSPVVVGCDGAIRRTCNYGHYPELNRWDCQTCAAFARHTHALSGLPVEWIGEIAPAALRMAAADRVTLLTPADYADLVHRGIPVGKLVRQSVAHFLRTDRLMEQPESIETYKAWLIAGCWLVEACEALLDRHQPEVVFMLNGLFAPERIMLETARRRGVRVVCYEVGFRPHSFFFQHNRPTDMCDAANWPRYRDVPLTAEENQRLDRYLSERATGGGYLLNYFPNLVASRETICREFGIDPSKKLLVLFPNITWDSTLFEKNVGFNSMADWIEETVRFTQTRGDAQLIIRVHPAEVILPGSQRDSVVELIRRKFPVLPKNVIVIPPDSGASSYALMELADCGLVYGSTTGLEMGVRGVPVIVAGQIYYRGLGFTHDADDRAHYVELLANILSGAIARRDPSQHEAWRRYAHFAIFRAAIPVPQIHYPRVGVLPTLTYATVAELAPGKEPNLDVVCEGIMRGTPFLAARPTP